MNPTLYDLYRVETSQRLLSFVRTARSFDQDAAMETVELGYNSSPPLRLVAVNTATGRVEHCTHIDDFNEFLHTLPTNAGGLR
jgi:hypothetical protein